jgi:hypothetical protein
MQRQYWFLGSLLLGAALIAPVGMQAQAKRQNCPDKGYYDRDRKDCHTWDANEDRAYQSWQTAQHKSQRDFAKRRATEQSQYWKWRHDHPDADNNRHENPPHN